MGNDTLRSPIRTAYLDEVYESAAKERCEYIGANMTQKETEAVDVIENEVSIAESDVMQIQNELIEYLISRGCKCIDKYL